VFDRAAILAGVDLAALADDMLGPRRGTQATPSWPCPVPTHAQTGRTPPVTVYSGRSGDQRWACHGCGAGGTAIDLVMAVQGVDVRRALELLTDRAQLVGVPPTVISRSPAGPRAADPASLAALHAYVRDCARRLWRPAGHGVRTWLTETRRVPAEVLARNLVGFDPGPGLQGRPAGVP
jgi:hypothetical protein